MFLLVITTSTISPVGADGPPTRANPAKWGVERTAIEDISSRTQNSKHFDLGNGYKTAVLSQSVHYQTATGDWKESNLDYRRDRGNNVMDRHPRYESRVTNSGIAITSKKNGNGIRWLAPARPSVNGRGAAFTNNGVIWTYTNTNSGLKAEAVVPAMLGPKTYTFTYQLLGEAAPLSVMPDGSIRGDGYDVSRVVIIGANGIIYSASGWKNIPESNQIAFTFDDTTLPQDAYPYVIDPTVIIQPDGTDGNDAQIRSVESTSNYCTQDTMWLGDAHGAQSRALRDVIRFDVSSIPSTAVVSAATLSIYEYSAADGSGVGSWAANLHRLLQNWVECEVTWDDYKSSTTWNAAGASTNGTDRIAAVSATLTLDGTSANAFLDWTGSTLTQDVQNFVDGTYAVNNGWLLEAPAAENQGGNSVGNGFRTSHYSSAAYRPKLSVTYTDASAAITGTIGDGATEQEVRDGGGTILVTLTDDTWVAAGATFDAQRQAIIDGLDAASSPATGWNNEVRDSIGVTSVVRTSDTLATITIAESDVIGYAITSTETVTVTVPAAAVTGGGALTATPTIAITAVTESAAITGTIGDGATEQEVRDGGGTILITLANTTWVAAAGSAFDYQRQNIINGLVAADSQTNGWNNEVKAKLGVTAVVRTSDTLVTITIPAGDVEDYRIVTNEVITTTVPATAIGGAALVATPTTTITGTVESAAVSGTLGGSGGTAPEIEAGGETVIITLTNTAWVADGATFNAQRQNILDGLVADDSDVNGWNAMAFAVGDVVRTSGTIVTITLSAESGYAIPSAETVTTTVPASAIVYAASLVAPETFTISPAAFATSGTRVSTAINLSGVTDLAYCAIGWETTLPTNTAVAIETSINGGSTYSTATNGNCPTGLTLGESLASITDFRVKATLTTTDTAATPLITALGLIVEDAGGSELCYQLLTTPSASLADNCGTYTGTMSFPIGPSTITSSTAPITSTADPLPNARSLAGQDVAQAVTGSATSARLFPAAGDEGGFVGLPLNDLVNEMSTVGDGLPVRFVWFIFLGIATIGAGMMAVHLTSNLFIAAGAMAAVMGFQMAIGSTGLLPGWILFAFIPLAAAFLLFRRGFPV